MAEIKDLELQPIPGGDPQASDKEHGADPSNGARSQHDAPPRLSRARSIALVLTLTGASFLNILSTQSIVIILPVIRDALLLPESRVQWVVSSYSLTFGCFLLLSGRLGDVFGKRLVFLLGSGLASLTNVINPFVKNEIAFYMCRGLAGIGGAANVPTAIGVLGVNFRSGKTRNYAFATYAAGSALGGAIGNILAGLISAYASWKWVFAVLAGFSAIITLSGIFVIPRSTSGVIKTKASHLLRSVDWIGGFLITAGLIALLFALTQGNIVGWSNFYIPVLIVIAALLMATFAAWQWYQEARTSRTPLLKPSLFENKRFAASVMIMTMFFSSYNVFVVFATYFWQDYQGLDTLQTTIRFIPQGVAGTLIAICMSFLISRISTCALLVAANIAVSTSCLLFAIPIPSDYSYWATGFPALILSVIGADVVWPCMTLFTSLSVPQTDQAMGGAINQSAGQIGRAVGLAITTALQMGVMQQHRVDGRADSKLIPWDYATLAGLRAANWYNFGLLLVSAVGTFVAFRGSGIVGKIECSANE